MRALRLDYHVERDKSVLGTVVLALCGVFTVFTLWQYVALHEDLAAWERTTPVRPTAGQRATSDNLRKIAVEANAVEVVAARDAMRRLSRPWNDLFETLESAQLEGVALLSIEPDPVKGMVVLTAEAKSAKSMLDFTERLQALNKLSGVTLVNHQIKDGDPLKALRFTIAAYWSGKS